MDDESLAGVLEVIDTEEPALHSKEAVKPEPKEEAPKETKTEVKEAPKEAKATDDDEETEDLQDYSRSTPDESESEDEDTSAPSQNENSEDTAQAVDEFTPTFEPEPQFVLEAPKYDENGYITNMDAQQYENYVIARATFQMQHQAWVMGNESKALDAAEKILPEIKTSPAVRTMVENARVASILNGSQINSFEAAKLVKEALGLSSKTVADKVAQAKAEGAQNAKVSIQIQKNAAVETQGSTKKVKSVSSKDANLSKRLKAGDDSAFAELFDQWDKDGKL